MTRLLLIASCLLLTGCGMFNRGGAIKGSGVTVRGIPDAGKPATLATSEAGESVSLPVGSRIIVTETAPMASKAATKDSPAQPATPAIRETVIIPAGPTIWQKTESRVNADTGTIDTTVAERKIDAAESRPLLYGALAAAAAAAFFVWASYPTPAMLCGGASVVLFLAWKVSGLPSWFYAVGLLAVAAGVFLWLGHQRGEKDATK